MLFGSLFFFFKDTSTPKIYTLSLHDALPISDRAVVHRDKLLQNRQQSLRAQGAVGADRSEEHTSELQSLRHLVCRLLLEKKKNKRWHEGLTTPLVFIMMMCSVVHTGDRCVCV